MQQFVNPVEGKIIYKRGPDDPTLPSGHALFRITQYFRDEDAYWRGQHPNAPANSGPIHGALDLGNWKGGDPVLAANDGVARTFKDGAGALIVVVKHAGGYETVYAHLGKFTIPQGSSVPVKRGQQIGVVGNTGLGAAYHLHYEVKHNGTKIDPEGFINMATFKDVPESHKFFDSIEWMVDEGLTSAKGVNNSGNFYPDGLVTRGQMSAFLHRFDAMLEDEDKS